MSFFPPCESRNRGKQGREGGREGRREGGREGGREEGGKEGGRRVGGKGEGETTEAQALSKNRFISFQISFSGSCILGYISPLPLPSTQALPSPPPSGVCLLNHARLDCVGEDPARLNHRPCVPQCLELVFLPRAWMGGREGGREGARERGRGGGRRVTR
jgi:hypothetical protein